MLCIGGQGAGHSLCGGETATLEKHSSMYGMIRKLSLQLAAGTGACHVSTLPCAELALSWPGPTLTMQCAYLMIHHFLDASLDEQLGTLVAGEQRHIDALQAAKTSGGG